MLELENILFVAGNVLFLVGIAVRDMLWLRIILVLGQLSLMPYYCCQPTPLYSPIVWGSLFVLINIVQIVLLIMEKRPVFLGEQELQLYRTVFSTLKPREFVKLLSIAEWKRAKSGDALLTQGKPVPALMLISAGRGMVELDGRRVAAVAAGQFIGEMGFLTEQPASASVVADAPIEYLAWTAPKLRTLLAESPGLHVKVQGILGNDLIAKLRQKGVATAHPSRLMSALRSGGQEAAAGAASDGAAP